MHNCRAKCFDRESYQGFLHIMTPITNLIRSDMR